MNLLKPCPENQNITVYPRLALPFRMLHSLVHFFPAPCKYQADFILFQKPLFPGMPEEETLDNGFVLRQAKKSDLQLIKGHPERFLPDVYMNRLVDGHGLFCAVKGEEIAAFVWYNFEVMCQFYGTQYEMIMGRLPKETAYLYDLYTYRRYRGQGLAASLLNFAAAFLSNCGVSNMASCISPSNIFSVMLYKKQGYSAQDFFHLYRIEGVKKCFRGTKSELKTIHHWIDS
jgi:ribosomal protein S18 acetylase RimI-like enzyme